MAVIIDTESPPGSWADAMRFPPFTQRIADETPELFRERHPGGYEDERSKASMQREPGHLLEG